MYTPNFTCIKKDNLSNITAVTYSQLFHAQIPRMDAALFFIILGSINSLMYATLNGVISVWLQPPAPGRVVYDFCFLIERLPQKFHLFWLHKPVQVSVIPSLHPHLFFI